MGPGAARKVETWLNYPDDVVATTHKSISSKQRQGPAKVHNTARSSSRSSVDDVVSMHRSLIGGREAQAASQYIGSAAVAVSAAGLSDAAAIRARVMIVMTTTVTRLIDRRLSAIVQ